MGCAGRIRLLVGVLAALGVMTMGVALGATTQPTEPAAAAAGARPATDDARLLPRPPAVTADAWIAFNVDEQTVLGGKAIREKRAIASLTKLMTALVVVEKTSRDDEVTVSRAATRVGGASGELKAGATYTVAELMDAMLSASANDAAHALAEHVSGSTARFIDDMNRRAVRLELDATTFASVNGLDTPGNGSTPDDLLKLAQAAMAEPRIAGAVGQERIRLSVPGGVSRVLDNRNPLVGSYPGVDGIKTGFTDDAGYCLILHYREPAQGSEYYIVLLGSDSEDAREADGRAMLDWVRDLRPRVELGAQGSPVASAPVAYTGESAELLLAEDLAAPMLVGSTVTERIVVPARLRPPLAQGTTVGSYEILRAGDVVAESAVVLGAGISELDLQDRLRWYADHLDEAWHQGVDFVLAPIGLAGEPEAA